MIFSKKNLKKKKAFTIIELVVSVAIFAFMTAFLLAKYGSFNQTVLLTNLAYDVALLIRNAQSYGLNVKSAPISGGTFYSNQFDYPYGVRISSVSSGSPAPNSEIIFFIDLDSDGAYDGDSERISTYKIKRKSIVFSICGGPGSCSNTFSSVDISFKRPDPEAIIKSIPPPALVGGLEPAVTYLRIRLKSGSGDDSKYITIYNRGQIYIQDQT